MKKFFYALETALWVIIALGLLLLISGFLILNVPGWLAQHPQYPAGWLWYIIWGIIGAILLFMALLWWWWGRVLKDREEARRVADSIQDDESLPQSTD